METYARDVIQHAEGIKAKHPDLPVFLFGHSMGGTVAALSVILRPDLFKGMVLSAPTIIADPQNSGFFLKLGLKVITAISPSFGVRQLDCEGISRIPEEVNEICEH
jgi:acylglycerol lipase